MKTYNIEKRLSALADGEKCEVTSIISLDQEKADLILFTCGDLDCSCIVYNDGALMHLQDWQSGYPKSYNEIAEFDWLTEDGRECVMFNGMPRIF